MEAREVARERAVPALQVWRLAMELDSEIRMDRALEALTAEVNALAREADTDVATAWWSGISIGFYLS